MKSFFDLHSRLCSKRVNPWVTAPPRRTFEKISLYCEKYSELIPLSFVLGFYVSVIMTRWWSQYTSIPWPDNVAVFTTSFINGQVRRPVESAGSSRGSNALRERICVFRTSGLASCVGPSCDTRTSQS